MRCILAVMALVSWSACGGAPPPNYDYSKEPDPRQDEYVFGVADSLDINVWRNPDLSTRVTIRPDGTITMPLIGDLHAAGVTPSQLKKQIEARLAEYIKLEGTEITIAVTNVASYHFMVSGEVGAPNVYTSAYYVTVAEAIALAGGFSRFAKRDRIRLMRRDRETGEVRNIPIDYNLIESGARPEMNLVILSDDSLYVP
ncbi:polysaccharide biosynthesis/export family protein [Haliangium sp.]|uniref:polysaccharide biosynthesis/export family protein n=1 Tax=Haliangium sp. TaxID=2663208 RepID=UPI003D12FBDA